MKPHIDTLDLTLLSRVREVVAGGPATESEVRRLADLTGGWARAAEAQESASERRLAALGANEASALSEIAAEVRRRDSLRRERENARSLLDGLETRARELRTAWLKHHAESARMRPPD